VRWPGVCDAKYSAVFHIQFAQPWQHRIVVCCSWNAPGRNDKIPGLLPGEAIAQARGAIFAMTTRRRRCLSHQAFR
jgi:hypothetical protein